MSYVDIFIIGWNLNALMFALNFFVAFSTAKRAGAEELMRDSQTLNELKSEFDTYYPNRRYEVLVSYILPFTAFFRTSYRFVEMFSFFNKNRGTKMVDFMIYKYSTDIEKAKH